MSGEADERRRCAEHDFMTDLPNFLRVITRKKDLRATQICWESTSMELIPKGSIRFHNLILRSVILFLDNQVVLPAGLREWLLISLVFGDPK